DAIANEAKRQRPDKGGSAVSKYPDYRREPPKAGVLRIARRVTRITGPLFWGPGRDPGRGAGGAGKAARTSADGKHQGRISVQNLPQAGSVPVAPALTFDLFTAETAACYKGEVGRSAWDPHIHHR
ncbi:hypothetical protein D4764_21G0003860, partial [Takifugu flavidus]